MSHNFYSDWWSRQKASSCSDPNSLSVQYRSLEEPGIYFIFLAVREPVEVRGVPWVFGRWKRYAPCVPDKGSPPLRFLYSEWADCDDLS
jgi:hypothetical protein